MISLIEELFQELRFDPNHHLGLGDIRLTLGQQEEIIEYVEELETIIERLRLNQKWTLE